MDKTTSPLIKEFFISYAGADKAWAEWIAWELQEAGHTVVLQAWDFGAGASFVLEMDKAARAERTIAVLTPAYEKSAYAAPEWAAAFAKDPKGEQRKFVPVRVADYKPGGLLAAIAYIDLVELDEEAARRRLIQEVKKRAGPPASAPPFPGSATPKPAFPGQLADSALGASDSGARASSLHQLTPPVSDFTGREAKLDELRKKVRQGGVASTGVRGMGGAGKTALARRLAAELKADYPDAQFELDLKGVSSQPLSPADVLSAILRVFHPTAQLPERTEELAALLRQTLDGHRALLLLDNTKDARQIAPLLPPPSGCLILVTSRQHFALPGLDAVNLGVMASPEACALLLKIEPRIGPEADVLAEACGRLPLALRLAASFLAVNKHIAPADYVRQLLDSRQRLQVLHKA